MSLKKAIPLVVALTTISLSALLTKADSPIEVQDAAPPVEKTVNKMVVASPKDPWKPTSVHVPEGSLADQFASKEDYQKHWVPSRSKKEDIPASSDDKDQELWQYRGKWEVEEASQLKGSGPGDLGLVMQNPAAHYAISRRLPKPVQFKGRDTVTIQYEVKFQNGLECGGAYMKLLSVDPNFDPAKFSDKSPYTIMFGPDKCGTTNKVHFIFRHKNLKSGKIVEHHHKNPPSVPSTYSKETHLYTLLIHPDLNTFEIKVDNDSKSKGSLLEDFEPPVVPPKEIDDVNDKKPSDWVDEPKMKDPNATKPDDWDESAPAEIEDAAATQPEDWLENEPEYVPDPDAKKPEDWDEEEDGAWTAPTIVNPKCLEGSGCGKWKRPMIKNPDYKGKWNVPMIDNPAYKGSWKPKKIPNPEYVEDKHPGHMTPIGALGLELWTMQEKIMFDNILVSDSMTAKQLEAWTKDTWVGKHNIELEINKAEEKENLKAEEAAKGSNTENLKEQFSVAGIKKFVGMLTTDPKNVLKQFPMLVGVLGAVFAVVFTLVISFTFGASKTGGSTKRNGKDVSDDDDVQEDEKDGDSAIKSSPMKKGALRKRGGKKDMAGEDKDTDETTSNENKADDDSE